MKINGGRLLEDLRAAVKTHEEMEGHFSRVDNYACANDSKQQKVALQKVIECIERGDYTMKFNQT